MRIVLDAMGGDYAPESPVAGAVQAVKDFPDVEIILTGIEDQINRELSKYDYPKDKISVVHTSEVIAMGEPPATAIRKKKDSSIVVGASLVKKGEAEAFVSAGSTGACMAAGLLKIGRIKGIRRPAIATIMPNRKDNTLLLDAGANVDIGPQELEQFALMGKIFADQVLRKPNPRVGLLNIGEEEHKGNNLTHETHPLLQQLPINFIGNIEGRDIFTGDVDVVVCDGFVGNIVLKTAEGLGKTIMDLLEMEIRNSKISMLGAMLMRRVFKTMKRKLDYTEYGGAPLLGVKGVTIISHGSSDAWAIRNGVRIARDSILNNVVEHITTNTLKEDEM